MSTPSIASALRGILTSIEQLTTKYGRPPVQLLAVGKTHPDTATKEAYAAGQRHFGENYVNELLEKAPSCPSDIRWHFIGHLQSNKAAKLVSLPNLYMVESVDSLKLAEKLDNACVKNGRTTPLNILVQVNTSGEESKSGCEPADCAELVRSIHDKCPHLSVCGLMTIGRYEAEPTATFFEILNACKKDVFKLMPQFDTPSWVMSMGMSHDMELAIANGATEVRVGTAIFGARNYGKEKEIVTKEAEEK